MPINVNGNSANALHKRATVIYSNLPIDRECNAGSYVAIEVLAQDFNIDSNALSAKRGLMAKGYPQENIAVLEIK